MYKFLKDASINRKGRNYGAHVALISLFIIYEISILWVLHPKENLFLQLPYYLPAIGLFYFHSLMVMRFWRQQIFYRILVILLTVIEIIVYVILSHSVSAVVYKMQFENTEISGFVSTIKAIWKSILILGISCGYWVARRNIYNAQLVKELQLQQALNERKQFEQENAYLRAQINPHFIKNTINYVYGLVENVSKDAGDALLLLAEFIDYSYGNAEIESAKLVDIDEEIEQVDCYLKITKLRYQKNYSINFENNLPPDLDFKIPPMLILTFIENMTRHGYIDKPQSPAIVKLYIIDGTLHFETRNLVKTKRPSADNNSKVGLENSKTRLAAYYPGRYTLLTAINADYFELKLSIRL